MSFLQNEERIIQEGFKQGTCDESINWMYNRRHVIPDIYAIAKKTWIIKIASVDSEALFSQLALTYTDGRPLSPSTVDSLLFLSENFDRTWKFLKENPEKCKAAFTNAGKK